MNHLNDKTEHEKKRRYHPKHWIDTHMARVIVGIVVLLNAAVLGALTFAEKGTQLYEDLTRIDHIIVGIFIIEMILRMVAHHRHFFKHGWNTFDFIVVFSSLIPIGLHLDSLRGLRILRLFYFIEISKKLRHILHGVYYAMPGFLSVTMLLVIMFYTYAIIGVAVFKHPKVEAFQTLSASIHTLFQVLSGDDWYAILRGVREYFPFAWMYFYAYYISMVFITLNLFIGVIVSALQTAEEDLERVARGSDDDKRDTILKEVLMIREELQELTKKKRSPAKKTEKSEHT